jgi:hypothetical protein
MTVAEEGQDSNPQSKIALNEAEVDVGALVEGRDNLVSDTTPNYVYESTHVQKASN